MKSSIIPREEANNYNIELLYQNLSDFSFSSPFDNFFDVPSNISDEEKKKLEQILENFFLHRKESVELKRKFKDFFDQELKKDRKIPPSQKFIDFLIAKKISGSHPRKKGTIISEIEKQNVHQINLEGINHEIQEYPKVIRKETGEISAIEVRCNCGEIIRIDLEFE
ncbi:MAG: hypothetical protein N2560_00895 [Ignavibacteria bacterium]|nr:hypothetical protein [Ignavibacteria bacterium]